MGSSFPQTTRKRRWTSPPQPVCGQISQREAGKDAERSGEEHLSQPWHQRLGTVEPCGLLHLSEPVGFL